MKIIRQHSLKLMLTCMLTLLAGCATSSDPQALQQKTTTVFATHNPEYSLDKATQKATLEHIAHKPLSLHDAVQLMLVNSPQVTAELHTLGLADAKRIQAGLIRNPVFSIGALYPETGDGWKLDFGLSQSLADIFTRKLRQQVADDKLVLAQIELQQTLQELIHDTSNAYTNAVAAKQLYTVQQQHYDTLLARQQLAASIYAAGNMSEVNYLFYEQERQNALRKLQERKLLAEQKQLELGYHLGLSPSQSFLLPDELPSPSMEENFSTQSLLNDAQQHRQDLQQLTQRLAGIAPQESLLTRETWLSDMELGIIGEREFDGARAYGPELAMELPLFNRGAARKQVIQQQRLMLLANLENLGLKIQKDVYQSLNALNLARNNIKDIKASIATVNRRLQLSQREVNYMLSSPFDLLRLVQQKNQVQQDYIQNLKKYWQARAGLELAVGMSLPVNQQAVEDNERKVEPESTHHQHESENAENQHHNHHQGHHHD